SSSTKGAITFATRVATASAASSYDSSVVAALDGHVNSAGKEFIFYVASFTITSSTDPAPVFGGLTLSAATTAFYLSPIKFLGTGITSWGSFSSGESAGGGKPTTYQIRAASFSFTNNSS